VLNNKTILITGERMTFSRTYADIMLRLGAL
jgi:hypothetical protein